MSPGDPSVALPRPYRVVARRDDTVDTATLTLESLEHTGTGLPPFASGQFGMLTVFGVGEVPISLAGADDSGHLTHTMRAVGAVSRALHAARPGDLIGVRGPFGTGWDVASAAGHDVVVVAGGIGLAPLRPVVLAVLAERARYGRLVVLVGARPPGDLLYGDELAAWARHDRVQVAVTVDRPDARWTGDVGVVTTLLPRAEFAPERTIGFVCGPEIRMRFAAEALLESGIPAGRIRVSLERNMRCATGWCGHCQRGPLLLCRDGPVVGYDVAEDLMSVREL